MNESKIVAVEKPLIPIVQDPTKEKEQILSKTIKDCKLSGFSFYRTYVFVQEILHATALEAINYDTFKEKYDKIYK